MDTPKEAKKIKNDPNVLSSSDKEEQKVNPNNKIAICMMKKLKVYKEKAEAEKNKAQKHKRFAEITAFLLQGLQKIKVI